MESITGTGLRLISFDGGGARVLSQLKIMEAVMCRIQYDLYPDDPDRTVLPCECFDMMGGSDMGGTIAIMFSKLRMPVEDVMDECHQICSNVYVDDLSPEERSLCLRQFIEKLLERRGLPVDLKLGKDSRLSEEGCPCFVVATLKSSMNNRVKLRTYRTRTEPASNITVVEAIIATCAMQPTFTAISVGPVLRRQELVGGAMGTGNPCLELVLEAFDRFKGDSRLAVILSVGSGHPGTLSAPEQIGNGEWDEVLCAMVTNCEEIAQSMEMQMGHLGVYFRFSVDQGLQNHHEAEMIHISWLSTQTQTYLQDVRVSRRLDQCTEGLRLRQGLVTLERLKHTGSQPVYKDIPALTSYFVMREEPWNRMKLLLDQDGSSRKQRVLVISGMAGCGKTQLLIHFTTEFRSRFRYVFFVDASSKESIQADLINHVRTAGPMYSQATFADALSFFSNPRNLPWLIAYDNCDDVKLDLRSLLPNCSHGSIILTTRNRSRGQFASENDLHLELDVMSDEEAVEAIIKSARLQDSEENKQSAGAIAKELGNLPVALAQAGSYIFETSCSCVEYLSLVRNSKAELMEIPTADRHHRGAYAAFDLSYQRLPIHVQNFLHLLGCVHFANFPMAAVRVAAQAQFRTDHYEFEEHDDRFAQSINLLMDTFCPGGSWSDLGLHKMSQILQNYSLASFNQSSITSLIQMHPLLHFWAFQRLSSSRKVSFLAAASRLIACVSKEDTLHQYLIGHTEVLLSTHKDWEVGINDKAAFGYVQRKIGLLENSQKIWEGIYHHLVRSHGSLDLRVARAGMELAEALDNAGLDMMERLEKEAVQIREALLGVEHSDTLHVKGNLSGTYERQGKLKEAENLRTDVLEIQRRTLGPENEETIDSEHWLAQIYHSQGRHLEAKTLQEQVLKVRREQLGDTHLYTLSAMYNLSLTYYSLGRYSNAQELQEQVLKARKEQLGNTHPDTLTAMHNLALSYYSLDRYSNAQELQEQVLKARKEQLGNTHPDNLTAMRNLALSYYSLHRYSNAQELQEQILKVRKEQFGNTHPDTLTAMHSLGLTYHSLRRYSDAQELQEQVLKVRKERLDDTHRDTLSAMHNLGLTYYSLGRHSDARGLQEQVLKLWKEQFGDTHPNTLTAMHSLALSYYSLGRYSNAQELQEQILKVRKERLDDTHRDTLSAMHNLGLTYYSLGRHSDARGLQEQVLKVRKERLDDTHRDTLSAMHNLGLTYYSLGRHSDARGLQEQVLKVRKERLDNTHRDTLSVMHELSATYYSLGRYSDAQELEEHVVKMRKMQLGENHLDTLLAMNNLACTYCCLERWTQARELAVEVAQGRMKNLGIDHPEYRGTVRLLEHIDVALAQSKLLGTSNLTVPTHSENDALVISTDDETARQSITTMIHQTIQRGQ